MAPNAKMSVRVVSRFSAVRALQAPCYQRADAGQRLVAVSSCGAADAPAASSQFEVEDLDPVFVSMTLPGFKSRCTIPPDVRRPWLGELGGDAGVSSATADHARAARRGFALEVLHHQEVDGPITTDVVQRADVGM
jgi:hypothetical protein